MAWNKLQKKWQNERKKGNIDKSFIVLEKMWLEFVCTVCILFEFFQHSTEGTVQLSIQFIQIAPQKFYGSQSCQEHKREEEKEERKYET